MLEKKLNKLLEEAKKRRKQAVENEMASYYNDSFDSLSKFILKKLDSRLVKLRNKNTKIIADHFDEILPYIVNDNINILLFNINSLIEQPNFKEKFIEGLKKYPYPDKIDQIFYIIWTRLNNKPNKFDNFIDSSILKTISTMNVSRLDRLNEENQKIFLNILAENKCNIPYSEIMYKGNSKQVIYDNLLLFTENSQNLYSLMKFVKDNPSAYSKVKDYIDNNPEKAVNSIFYEINKRVKIEDTTLKEVVKLIILDVLKNENVKLSDITYNGGGLSSVLLIGNKVIKIGDRATKSFPNNPYIISPLLRKKLEFNGAFCFVEVTERVDTSKKASKEELYQLFKKLRNLNLVWTDIKEDNVGRLKKENIIHWRQNLNPTDGVLGLDVKRGETILKEGDLVILDADFIYDENDPNINYINNKDIYDEFEKRYQSEIKELKEQETKSDLNVIDFNEINDYEVSEHKGIHR